MSSSLSPPRRPRVTQFPICNGAVGTVEDRDAGHEQVGAGRAQGGGAAETDAAVDLDPDGFARPEPSRRDYPGSSVGDSRSVSVAKAD
jgi:hypothetical protein